MPLLVHVFNCTGNILMWISMFLMFINLLFFLCDCSLTMLYLFVCFLPVLAGNIDHLTVYFCPVLKKRDTKAKARQPM